MAHLVVVLTYGSIILGFSLYTLQLLEQLCVEVW